MRTQVPDTLPDADAFRSWLRQSMALLSLRPSGDALKLGLGRNTLQHFLGKHGRDMTLGTASRLTADIGERARREGIEIPPLPRLDLSGGESE
ncbi:hypothetical protein [Chachezhania antarctica]|uniref:hypothetical protein n=1 Tax=Chachezhania antarctica TaxID=2340860 RepID=UPI0013CE4F56|nr:hypothetical protein [Chachezhania antarctica]|tara:strand:+ start:5943 stop:6221 length:279 start_codon:yes stop_codon:yes gene_type:complete